MDETAGLGVAHHRVAGIDRVRVGGLDLLHGSQDDVADLGASLVAGEHGVDLAEGVPLTHPGDDLAHVLRSQGGPRQAPYPWLEKWTVWTGQTSTPSRCIGKTAAELPTWP